MKKYTLSRITKKDCNFPSLPLKVCEVIYVRKEYFSLHVQAMIQEFKLVANV